MQMLQRMVRFAADHSAMSASAIFLLQVAIRAPGISSQSIWLDESLSLLRTQLAPHLDRQVGQQPGVQPFRRAGYRRPARLFEQVVRCSQRVSWSILKVVSSFMTSLS